MTTKSPNEKFVNAINHRDALLVKLMIEADNLAVPIPTRELLMDYLHSYIVANSLAEDNQMKIVSANKRLNIRVDELEDRVDELEDNFTNTADEADKFLTNF